MPKTKDTEADSKGSYSSGTEANPRVVLPLCAIIFFSVLNGTMFNVAIPSIKAQYDLLPSAASWVMTGYIIIFALGSIVYGKLADKFRVRDLISIGLIIFNIGSLIGLFTVNYPMLIAARAVQAAGASAIPALAMIVATRYFPSHSKGRVLGATSATVAFAAGVGPIAGGFIAGHLHWRYLFPPTLMTLAVLPYLKDMLPSAPPRGGSFDIPGAVMLGAGVSLILVFVTQGYQWALIAGVLALAYFIVHIGRTKEPFINPALFFNKRFRNTIILTFISTGAVFGMFFMVPLMLKDLYGYGPRMIGLIMFPGAMSAAFIGPFGGRMADRRGGKFMVNVGLALYILSFLWLSTISGIGSVHIGVALVLSYVGFAFLQSSLPHTVSSELSPDEIGIGMGIYTLFFFIAGAFTSAIIGKMLDREVANISFNPLVQGSDHRVWLYSNIFMTLAVVLIGGGILFWRTMKNPGSQA